MAVRHSQGQATDIAIQAEEILKLKKQINEIYAKHTRQPLSVIGESTTIAHTLHRGLRFKNLSKAK